MGKERQEIATGGSGERRRRKSRPPAPPYALEGNFERAFADALNDILMHEVHERRRRRAA